MSQSIAIVLAAGKSTRMKSALPKVVHEVGGRPMVDYVFDAARAAGATRLIAVVGHQADHVQQVLSCHTDLEFAHQTEQKGTGHAVMMCAPLLEGHEGPVMVLAGDTPLLTGASLRALADVQSQRQAACIIGSATTANNHGLGRVVRGPTGQFERIVEEKDATNAQKAIQEINTGCYVFDGPALLSALKRLTPVNAQGEYYLTDCPAILLKDGQPVDAANVFSIAEAMGVNTRVQLAEVTALIQQHTHERLMLAGVTIAVPDQTVIDSRAEIGADTVIEPFTTITGHVKIGTDCRIGPYALLEGPLELASGTTIGAFQVLRG